MWQVGRTARTCENLHCSFILNLGIVAQSCCNVTCTRAKLVLQMKHRTRNRSRLTAGSLAASGMAANGNHIRTGTVFISLASRRMKHFSASGVTNPANSSGSAPFSAAALVRPFSFSLLSAISKRSATSGTSSTACKISTRIVIHAALLHCCANDTSKPLRTCASCYSSLL